MPPGGINLVLLESATVLKFQRRPKATRDDSPSFTPLPDDAGFDAQRGSIDLPLALVAITLLLIFCWALL